MYPKQFKSLKATKFTNLGALVRAFFPFINILFDAKCHWRQIFNQEAYKTKVLFADKYFPWSN